MIGVRVEQEESSCGNFHAGFASPFIAPCVSPKREGYSSHKNSLSSSSCPTGLIARREICMCRSPLFRCGRELGPMWDEFEQDRQEEKEGELLEIKILVTCRRIFYSIRLYTRRSKAFLSLSLSLHIRKISERKGLHLLVFLRCPSIIANDRTRASLDEKKKKNIVQFIFFFPLFL